MNNISNDNYVQENTRRNFLNILTQISFPYIFIVSIIGICGNFLTILMLSKRPVSKHFNNCTLIALALTDLLFNFTLVSRSINDLTKSNSDKLCRLLSFLSHLAELLSACFTAHFTAQRFIAVRFPLSVLIEKKIHLAHYLIVSLFIIIDIIYSLALVKYNAYDSCQEELELGWFISDALLSFLIPFTIIIILNILIIFHLKKSFLNNQQYFFTTYRQHPSESSPLNFRNRNSSSNILPLCTYFQPKSYENFINSNPRVSWPSSHTNGDQLLQNGRAHSMDVSRRSSSICSKSQSYRVTRMLIIVSTCFLLLNAPSHICTIGFKIYSLNQAILIDNSNEIPIQSQENFKQYNQTLLNNISFISIQNGISNDNNHLKWIELFYILIIITQHIAYASYSINFFLYSCCGMKFRRELLRYVSKRCGKRRTSRSTTVQNTS